MSPVPAVHWELGVGDTLRPRPRTFVGRLCAVDHTSFRPHPCRYLPALFQQARYMVELVCLRPPLSLGPAPEPCRHFFRFPSVVCPSLGFSRSQRSPGPRLAPQPLSHGTRPPWCLCRDPFRQFCPCLGETHQVSRSPLLCALTTILRFLEGVSQESCTSSPGPSSAS